MLLKALSTIAILAVTFIGLVIFLFSPDPYWFLAMVIIVLAWIIYFLFFIPYKPTATRARWAFWACFTIITAVLTTYFVLRLLAHPITYTISPETFSFIDFIEIKQKTIPVNPRISSLVLGSIIGFFFTSVL
ncbi:MAG: hypothetical protein KDI62_24115, partial [Anaerolineae bacterium]|nr:hypothetical protein [Anaerolineae bacterium]